MITMEPETDEIAIIKQRRKDSNRAIYERDVPGIAQYWMDDIIVISGEGGQYIGKKLLVQVFKDMFKTDPPVFERHPAEVIIGESEVLAWETGTWEYKTDSFRGNYSAMWRKVAGEWLIQSELFVSLD
jgi:ketosteroid isomerase-like protein